MIKRVFNRLGIKKSWRHEINGRPYNIPVFNGLGMANFGEPEPWMAKILTSLSRSETIFLDVGVNVGQTLLYWRSIHPDMPYIGCEPNPLCVSYVQSLIEENRLPNCTIQPYAIGEKSQSSELFILANDKSDSSASTIKDFRKGETRSPMKIEIKSLIDLEIRDFDLVKIDVEGAELEVLKSVFTVNQEATIICEILPVYSTENEFRLQRQKAVENLLKEHDYLIYRIIKGEHVKLELLNEIGIHSDLEACDYIFIPYKNKESLATLL